MAQGPQPGDPAPDFELDGTHGHFKLSEQRGRNVILLFYPGDETAVCTKQFCSYRDRQDDMDSLDAVVVGLSGKGVESKEMFAAKHGLTVPLLADADAAVASAYGVHGRLGTKRATIVIDGNGVVRAKKVHAIGLTYESVDDLAALLSEAGAPA